MVLKSDLQLLSFVRDCNWKMIWKESPELKPRQLWTEKSSEN
jgi:hypothetical protein